jgi:hypothetical protein
MGFSRGFLERDLWGFLVKFCNKKFKGKTVDLMENSWKIYDSQVENLHANFAISSFKKVGNFPQRLIFTEFIWNLTFRGIIRKTVIQTVIISFKPKKPT